MVIRTLSEMTEVSIFKRKIKIMKRTMNILVVTFAALIAFLFLAVLPQFFIPIVSADEFIFRIEEAGYIVEEKTHSLEQVTVYLIAYCGAFDVEYMVHETVADARFVFGQLINDLEQLWLSPGALAQTWGQQTWGSSGINSRFESSTFSGHHATIIRIRDTIIFASTAEGNATDISDVLKMLGQ